MENGPQIDETDIENKIDKSEDDNLKQDANRSPYSNYGLLGVMSLYSKLVPISTSTAPSDSTALWKEKYDALLYSHSQEIASMQKDMAEMSKNVHGEIDALQKQSASLDQMLVKSNDLVKQQSQQIASLQQQLSASFTSSSQQDKIIQSLQNEATQLKMLAQTEQERSRLQTDMALADSKEMQNLRQDLSNSDALVRDLREDQLKLKAAEAETAQIRQTFIDLDFGRQREIAALQEEIDHIQQARTDLKQALEAAGRQLSDHEDVLNQERAQTSTLQRQVRTMEAELVANQAERRLLQTQLDEATLELKRSRLDYDRSRERLHAQSVDLDNAVQSVQESARTNKELRDERHQLQQEKAAIEADRRRALGQLENELELRQNMAHELDQTRALSDRHQDQIQQLSAFNAELEQKLSTALETIGRNHDAMNTARSSIERLGSTQSIQQEQLEEAHRTAALRANEYEALRMQFDQRSAQLNDARRDLDRTRTDLQAAQADLRRFEADRDQHLELKQQLDDALQQVADLQAQLRDERQRLQQDLHQRQKDIADLRTALQRHEARLVEVEDERDRTLAEHDTQRRADADRLQAVLEESAALNTTIDQLWRQLSEQEGARIEAEQRRDQALQLYDDERQRLHRSDDQIDDLRSQLSQRQTQLAEAQADADRYAERLAACLKQSNDHSVAIQALTQDARSRNRQAKALQKKVGRFKVEKRTMQVQLLRYQTELHDLGRSSDAQAAELTQAKADLRSLQARHRRQSDHVREMSEAVAQQSDHALQHESQLAQLRDDLQLANGLVADFRHEAEARRAEVDVLRQQLDQSRAETALVINDANQQQEQQDVSVVEMAPGPDHNPIVRLTAQLQQVEHDKKELQERVNVLTLELKDMRRQVGSKSALFESVLKTQLEKAIKFAGADPERSSGTRPRTLSRQNSGSTAIGPTPTAVTTALTAWEMHHNDSRSIPAMSERQNDRQSTGADRHRRHLSMGSVFSGKKPWRI